MHSLAEINRMDREAFVRALGAVFEHSPWVAARAFDARPFGSVDELHRAMSHAVERATEDERLALVRAHPELAGREARTGELTAASGGEQARLGLTLLASQERARITELNRRYREKFGFPCIIALKLHDSRESVVAELDRRTGNDRATELADALQQIGHIARGRLEKLVAQD
jgi:2-oxo-4-hydroxy-4-carboxy-5-ureidoimidazoline decarboxylase